VRGFGNGTAAKVKAVFVRLVQGQHGVLGMSGVVLLGTTTLRRMLKVARDKRDPLYRRIISRDYMVAAMKMKEDPTIGDDVVYVYYHPERDETVMATVEGDTLGEEDSSATFSGKADLTRQAKGAVPIEKSWFR
jgi:hypothetical protein